MKAKENEAPENANGGVVSEVLPKVEEAPTGEEKPSHEVKDEGCGKTDDHDGNKTDRGSKPVDPSHDASTFDCIFISLIFSICNWISGSTRFSI